MRKSMCLVFIFAVFFAGCAGRDPNPIATSLLGDENLSCEALLLQKQQAMDEIKRLEPKTNKFVTNSFWFIVFPFLMDVKDAEKIEYDAFRRRSDYLTTLMTSKGCTNVNDTTTSLSND